MLCLLLFLITAAEAYAQQKLQLKDVAKIEFITKGHFMSRYYKRFTVINEGSKWKSYQTFDRTDNENVITNTDTTYQTTVSLEDVKKMLEKANGITSKKDSVILPKPTRALLVKYVDSIARSNTYQLSPEKRERYITMGRKKVFFKKAADWAIHKPKIAGSTNYVLLITKLNDTVTFQGYHNGIYHTPWYVNKNKYYDKAIGAIFNKVTGGRESSEIEKYYHEIYSWIYSAMFNEHYAKDKFTEIN